ncbi:hypothetical protein HGRIS_009256 [Hohenbuehelia grisea]|uniref:Uncharacterized protein n=1 Tax=Hohenbuehelia grisea TaxID=104357 RepID=A0ABR3J0Y3_9AGAR
MNSSELGAGAGSTDVPVNIVQGTHSELIAYLVFNLWPSHFGIPLLLLVILLSKGRIQRHATFINFLVVWIVVGISSVLLLYAGKHTGPEPPKMLCLFQSSMIYGMPPMTSTAAFALVFQMFLVIRGAYHGVIVSDRDSLWRTLCLLVGPYVALFITAISTAIVGAANPRKISRDRRFFYCSVENNTLTNVMSLATSCILVLTVIFEVWTVVLLFKHSRALRRNGVSILRTMDLSFPIRIIAFGFYILIALSLNLISITSPQTPVPDLIISTASSVVLFIFGTQTDILLALCFWRRNSTPPKVPDKDSPVINVTLSDPEASWKDGKPPAAWN